MTTTDHRAEAEAYMRREDRPAEHPVLHLLAAIHDELRRLVSIADAAAAEAPEQTATLHAIRDRMTEPRWIIDDAEPGLRAMQDRINAIEASRARDRARREAEALAEEVDRLRSEKAVDMDTIERLNEARDRWVDRWRSCDREWARDRAQIISLTGERDDLRDRVPTDDEVVVKIAAPHDLWRFLAVDLREVARCGRSEGFRTASECVDALAEAIRAALGGERA